MKMKTNNSKSIRLRKISSKREVYSNKNLPQETRKISNKKPNLIPKAMREKRTNKMESQQKGRNQRSEQRYVIEIKKAIDEVNETTLAT